MTTPAERWERIYERFDPNHPARRAEWRADRPYSPVDRLLRTIRRRSGPFHTLFTGTVGTGKTTELVRTCAEAATARGVVFLDLESHLRGRLKDPQAIDRIAPWEVVFLVGLAVWRFGREELDLTWSTDETGGLERAWVALAEPGSTVAQVDLARLVGGVGLLVAGGAVAAAGGPVAPLALAAVAPGLKELAAATAWTLPLGRRRDPRVDQDAPVREMLTAVNRLVHRVQSAGRPLLVVVDGLDRVADPAQAQALFCDSALLAELECGVVLTAPLSVPRQRVRGFETEDLANVPVVDQPAAPEPSEACGFFVEVWRRRVDPADREAIPEPLVRRLGWASGGVVRHFCALVREVAEAAWEVAPVAGKAHVDEAVDRARRKQEYGLTAEDIVILEGVMRDRAHRLPADARVPALLDQHHLLPYPNEHLWYYPHPILTVSLLKTGR